MACALLLTASVSFFFTAVKILEAAQDAVNEQRGKHWSSYIQKRDYVCALIGMTSLLSGLAALFWQQLSDGSC